MKVELPKMVAGGITSIKVRRPLFLLPPVALLRRALELTSTFPSLQIYMTYAAMKLNDSQILDVLLAARKLGVTVMCHCENNDM